MLPEPKEWTEDEVRNRLLDHFWMLIDYWDRESRATTPREKLEGLAFSILSTLDGESIPVPGFIVAPHACAEDKEYHISQGENWYPENHQLDGLIKSDLGGGLHEHFHERNPKRSGG